MESLQDPSQIDQYKVQLEFSYAGVNCFGKIRCFWREEWEIIRVTDSIQEVKI